MKSLSNNYLLLALLVITSFGCKKFLDRPPLTSETDLTAWASEDNVRLYANQHYERFFPGYGLGFSTTGAAFMGYQFSDDVFLMGNQGNFARSVPNSSIWGMVTLRSLNLMIDRIQNKMSGILSEEAYNHWMGIGRFFRGLEYASLATRFGDVPYYDHVPSDLDKDDLYKPRTSRNEVMDAVYDDLRYALQNVRINDGALFVNRYVVAGFISRAALYEGTWQKYYYNNNERANKFLKLAEEAGDIIISSNRYDIVTDFRSLFASNSLANNKDVIFYRNYDPAVSVTHSVASYNNLSESIAFGPTTDLLKSFICVDGNVWQNSETPSANNFAISKMIVSRDSRLEASFYNKATVKNRASYWYVTKFIPRDIIKIVETTGNVPNEFSSSRNETDYPVFRYAEALLNWIEAKAELSTIGGGAVTQADIDISINKIRNRPLAQDAIDKGVVKTAALNINALPNDPARDPSVPALLWEIRRERRMELAFEHSRFEDLKRWSKLNYMETDTKKDLLSGGWVNFPTELPDELSTTKVGQIAVVSLTGTETVYSGTNASAMNGFYKGTNTNGRLPFLNQPGVNPYLTPVGRNEIDDYTSKGYTLAQTEGWPQN
ncbi:MAG TPA: RagB/SusD family nutrient uptake outer membrane protein [Niabella sp.]|nr:RagB/SusD family nutrient uptake outer membrane protein [Niabella sp.]